MNHLAPPADVTESPLIYPAIDSSGGSSAVLAMQPAVDTRSLRPLALRMRPSPGPVGRAAGENASLPCPRLGRWQLVEQVASGEQTAIFRARPADPPTSVRADYLVKVARAEGSDPKLAAALLRREKTVLRSARSSHLPALLDSDLRHEPPYLVLANLGHGPLNPSAPHPMRLALWRTRQAATAVAALRQAGWIHTRITPSALLYSERGHLTLHELGWARRIGTAECSGDKLLAADLRYVAPEMLCDAETLTPACDVYALGLLLIELLIGRPAVDIAIGWQAALAHLRGQISDAGELRSDLSPSLVQLLARMTAREPLRRPVASEVERELVRLEVSQLHDDGNDRPQLR